MSWSNPTREFRNLSHMVHRLLVCPSGDLARHPKHGKPIVPGYFDLIRSAGITIPDNLASLLIVAPRNGQPCTLSSWYHATKQAGLIWQDGVYTEEPHLSTGILRPYFPELVKAMQSYCPTDHRDLLYFCGAFFPKKYGFYWGDEPEDIINGVWSPLPSTFFPQEFVPPEAIPKRFTLGNRTVTQPTLATELNLV